MKHAPVHRGFTIIELLVAASVIIIMMTLVGQLFTTTTEAVSRGAATSDIISGADAFVAQLRVDGREILGPQDGSAPGDATGGVLIIVQKRYSDVAFPRPGGGESTRSVRSDQLVFIRNRGDEYPICPSSNGSFTPANDNGNAQYLRVWYGHVKRTERTGADVTEALGKGSDVLCTEWLLGRQALFLGESNSLGPSIRYRGGWVSNADLAGVGTPPPPNPPTGLHMWMGWSDYASFSLENTGHTHGSLVGALSTAGPNPGQRLGAELSAAIYHTRAVELYSYAVKRLRANPMPPDSNPHWWAIAQMHPIMIDRCSDFIVEFAGDYATGAGATYAPDGLVDVDNSGEIRWYTHSAFADPSGTHGPKTYPLPSGMATDLPYRNAATPDEADASFVWRHDDELGKFTGGLTPQPSLWPYLLRIRYRLHDARGQLMSGAAGPGNLDRSHGVWFEHIVRVRRP